MHYVLLLTLGRQSEAQTRLIWQPDSGVPLPPLSKQGAFINELFNDCDREPCASYWRAPYEPSGAPPPGKLLTGQFNSDAIAVVAQPFYGLKENPDDSSGVIRGFMPKPVPTPKTYRFLAPTSVAVQSDKGTVQNAYQGFDPKVEKQFPPQYMTLYQKENKIDAETIKKLYDKTGIVVVQKDQNATGTGFPVYEGPAQVDSLQEVYRKSYTPELIRARERHGGYIKSIHYPGSKVEVNFEAPRNQPFVGWGDNRLRMLYNSPGQPRVERRLVVDPKTGKPMEQFGTVEATEPVPLDMLPVRPMEGYDIPKIPFPEYENEIAWAGIA